MAEYKKIIYVPAEEAELISPIGTDQMDEEAPATYDDVVGNFIAFDTNDDTVGWSYANVCDPSDVYYDRFYTFKFEDGYIMDVNWTFMDEGDSAGGHWYFTGAKFGTDSEILCDVGEYTQDCELVLDPVPDFLGEYIYRHGDDTYVAVLMER